MENTSATTIDDIVSALDGLSGAELCIKAVALVDQYASFVATDRDLESIDRLLESMKESRMERGRQRSSIEDNIEHSKCHWSQLTEIDSNSIDLEVAEISNKQVFKALQKHRTWGAFFFSFNEGADDEGELEVGAKFAEGAQAELYNAKVTWRHRWHHETDSRKQRSWVLKVFKKGTFLRHLRSQWPPGLFQFNAERSKTCSSGDRPEWKIARFCCDVYCGTLLKDGRFAFLMEKEQEDLRSLIDRLSTSSTDPDQGPFPTEDAELMTYDVAKGIDFLHSRNIVHRDLKASNVLVTYKPEVMSYFCYVADYECSIGVVGTGFFRAPEILQACKDKTVSQRPEIFTKESDVYSFGMTFYEILTGKLPFEGHRLSHYDHVLSGHHPEVPEYVDNWARELLSWCWRSNPKDRPTIQEILNVFRRNSGAVRGLELGLQQRRQDYVVGTC